jgi:hypothetical protein
MIAVASTLACTYNSPSHPEAYPGESILREFGWFCMTATPDLFREKLLNHPKGGYFNHHLNNSDSVVFGAKMEYGAMHRRFFITRGGLFGLGPALMKEGDLCVVLLGADVPFVIRPLETEGHYLLIGECYLYGVMDGEAIKEWEAGKSNYEKREIVFV